MFTYVKVWLLSN